VTKRFLSRFILNGLLALAFAAGSLAQTPVDRPRVYDVLNYTIRMSFDAPKKIVYGDTTVKLTPLATPLTSVDLDAVDMKFASVGFQGDSKELKFRLTESGITVELGRTVRPGDSVSLRFKYTISAPKKGVTFIAASAANDPAKRPAQIWTQNEPADARYWFPSFDFPSDKATSEEFITVKTGEVAIGNGALIDSKPGSDGTVTYHYRMDQPHSTYLTSFVVGDYVRLEDKHGNIPLGFYTYESRRPVAQIAFSRTKDMMATYETLTGIAFPFAKYDQIMVSGFDEISGMENVTATTLSDDTILFAAYPFGKAIVEDLISHELAHSWFGNLVTCKNWSELWLNEGFATFMEAVWREKNGDRAAYIRKLLEDRQEYFADDAIQKTHHALQNKLAKPDNSLFDATTYQRGGLVLHMLRETVGDSAFWKGVNIYLNKHKFDLVISSDLQAAMEEASGQKLQWFFDQWVYTPGYPRLEMQQKYNASTGQLQLTLSQVQKTDTGMPPAFRFPLDVEILTASGAVNQTFEITKRTETFTIKLSEAPTKLTVDKAEKVILKTIKVRE
jgi:aminopeptidase N